MRRMKMNAMDKFGYCYDEADNYDGGDYDCPGCDKHVRSIEQAAVHLKAVLAILYGDGAIDMEKLEWEIEELAGQLDMHKEFCKEFPGTPKITREEHPMSYFDDAVNMTRQYATNILQEIM